MINPDKGGPKAARPPLPPKVGFDVHVLKDSHHADEAGLRQIGETAYKLAGFRADLTAAELAQTNAANPAKVIGEPGVRDMRNLTWSAIDNKTSKDPDQVACAERLPDGNIRIYVACADVDEQVAQKSPLDQRALDNMTTVYTDLDDYTMLPKDLCNDKTVLLQGKDRAAIVKEFVVTPQGEIKDSKVYRAVVNNHCQLNYDEVDNWFDHPEQVPPAMQGMGDMVDQLNLQDQTAQWIEAAEVAAGRPPAHGSDQDHAAVTDGRPAHSQEAQRLVEMQMRTVNRANARYLLANNSPAIVRAREVSSQSWGKLVDLAKANGASLPAIPDTVALQQFLDAQKKGNREHFQDLQKKVSNLLGPPRYTVAVPGHDHELFNMGSPLSARDTGPNRLEGDLVNQRLVKAKLAGQTCPYPVGDPIAPGAPMPDLTASNATLHQIAEKSNRIERRCIDVMRQVQNSMAAFSMQEQIHKVFAGKVSGQNSVGSFVSLAGTKADGFVHDKLQKGAHVTVRVDSVDIEKGRIALTVVPDPSPTGPVQSPTTSSC